MWASCDTCLRSLATAAARSVSEMPAASRSAAVLLKCRAQRLQRGAHKFAGRICPGDTPFQLGLQQVLPVLHSNALLDCANVAMGQTCHPTPYLIAGVKSSHELCLMPLSIHWLHTPLCFCWCATGLYFMGKCFRQASLIADTALITPCTVPAK